MINTRTGAVTLMAGALIAVGPIVGAGSALADSPSPAADTLVLNEVASPMEDQRAIQNFTTQLGAATAIGGFTGGVIGAGIGCVIGLPAGGVGCLPGAVTGFGIGSVIGTIVVGGPTLAVAGADALQTLSAAPGTTRWN